MSKTGKMSKFEVTRTRMVVEVVTVDAETVREATARAESLPEAAWRVREQELLTVNTCEVPR